MDAVDLIDRAGLDALFDVLRRDGHELIGPTVRDGAIVYDTVEGTADLPVGWTDEQEGGHYRLRRRPDDALFGYAVGPHSWKKYLFPPRQTVFRARRGEHGLAIEAVPPEAPRRAFIGVRGCELRALAVQDRVFTDQAYADTAYRRRRGRLFLVAVHCGEPAATCFCTSMGTGPRAEGTFDLALTEVIEGERHYFTVEAGTDAGRGVLEQVPRRPAEAGEAAAAEAVPREAAARMGRHMETDGLPALLLGNLEHPRWQEVADRCLSCGNCTLVCPTCFCSTVEDRTDLAGTEAVRERVWDSCFNEGFSYIAGGSIRNTIRSRYRQWMTHKLATWHEQFDTSGCVGCGRCITWCPVGIDITEEAAAIRAADLRGGGPDG
jgi:ferredoxin